MSKKSKQEDLPGVEGPGVSLISIPEIDRQIDRYVAARDAHQLMTTKLTDAKAELNKLMHANSDKIKPDSDGTLVYRYDDLVATLKPGKEELKVKAAPEVA